MVEKIETKIRCKDLEEGLRLVGEAITDDAGRIAFGRNDAKFIAVSVIVNPKQKLARIAYCIDRERTTFE